VSAPRCFIHAVGIANALGTGCEAVRRGLMAGDTSGMRVEEGWLSGGTARVGGVGAELPRVPQAQARFDCRNNRFLLLALAEMGAALAPALGRVAPARFGVVLGTSTAGIAEGERAMAALARSGAYPEGYRYTQQEIGRGAQFLAAHLGLTGPAYVVSTACTSSVKAIAAACRLVRAGLCDAVLTGGADTLCRLTVNGFAALESTTLELCNPLSRNRRGINLGEGVALLLVSREPAAV
jgi:3-oxoacyl-[acyl-carrier-protein] synthase-1